MSNLNPLVLPIGTRVRAADIRDVGEAYRGQIGTVVEQRLTSDGNQYQVTWDDQDNLPCGDGGRWNRQSLEVVLEDDGPRSYTVGLPVTVTVHPDGSVTYDVDTSEAAREIERDEFSLHPEVAAVLDAEAVRRDHARRAIPNWFQTDRPHRFSSSDESLVALVPHLRAAGWAVETTPYLYETTVYQVWPPGWTEAMRVSWFRARHRAVDSSAFD